MSLATWTMNLHSAVGKRGASSPSCRHSRSSPCSPSSSVWITGIASQDFTAKEPLNAFKSLLRVKQIPTNKRKLPSFPRSLPIPVTGRIVGGRALCCLSVELQLIACNAFLSCQTSGYRIMLIFNEDVHIV